jgi:hypothetical protein
VIKLNKTKKDFDSVLNKEIKKAGEQRPIKRKSKKDDTPDIN